MEIIPVIDLQRGAAVRARHGARESYRPIETPLSPTSEPLDVAAGLLALAPFRTLYIADLDAIEAHGSHADTAAQIAARFPRTELWIDNGCRDAEAAARFLDAHPTAALVIGSESQTGAGLLDAMRGERRIVLSLDFRGDAFLGPPALLAAPELWPERVIVMTLARVGSDAGPDLKRAGEIAERAGGRALYLAGGLRDRRDLEAVAQSGAAGILVASALHDGRIKAADLAEILSDVAGSARGTGAAV